MSRPRVVMRKIRDVLRLSFGERLPRQRVSQATGLPPTTVFDYLKRAAAAGLAAWPLPTEIDDQELERRLFVSAGPPEITRPVPEWARVKNELRHKGVTLQLVWQEYLERHPGGYQYSQFCRLYHQWSRHLDVVLRGDHVAGQKMFVDFPGQTVPIYDPETEAMVMEAQIFVSVLGASNYVYAEALPSQQLVPWVNAHAHAFSFYGGCPAVAVPDYVDGNIIDVLCPTGLCGRHAETSPGAKLRRRRPPRNRPHNATGRRAGYFLHPPVERRLSMLETYFVKPQTVERIPASWIGSEIERALRANEAPSTSGGCRTKPIWKSDETLLNWLASL